LGESTSKRDWLTALAKYASFGQRVNEASSAVEAT